MCEARVEDEEEVKNENKMDLDTILVNEIGQFGWYQARTLALCAVCVIFSAWATSEYYFTTARISTRCLIPECDGPNPEFAPPWILNAVPGVSQSSFEQCERYANNSGGFNATCPATMFNQQETEPCTVYVYKDTHSVVYDYDLACDEWKRSLIGSIRTLGTFCSLPITGFVSDRWGRRVALATNAFNTAWIGLLRIWANNYWVFNISEFLEATFGAGIFSCAFILVMELIGPKYRVAGCASMNTFFAVGQVLMGFISWAVPNWRSLTAALYLPQLITISLFWIMNESVRWLMSKGRYDKSEEILKNAARVNKTSISEKSLETLRRTNEQQLQRMKGKDQSREPWLPVIVFKHKPIFIRCCVTPVWWFAALLVYYGLSINSVNMSGNQYLNYIAVSAVEIPGYWTSGFLVNKIGRKPVLMTAFWSCSTCMIAYIFLPTGMYSLSLAVYLIGKFSIAVVMACNYMYTTELYPTQYRHRLFAFSSMIGRIGSVLAPLTPALGQSTFAELPFVIFAGLSLVAGGLVIIMPETKGAKIPDTMEEAAALGTK